VSVLKVPEPKGWSAGSRPYRWAFLGGLALVGLALYWGIVATIRGHYLTTVVILGWMSLPLCLAVAMTLASFGRVSLRVAYDSTGTTVRPDRVFGILFFAGLVALIPSGILFVIFTPRGAIDIPMSRGMQIFSPAVMGFAVIVAISGLFIAHRRGGMGHLKLAATGIDNANVAFTKSFAWDDVVNVTDEAETKRTRKAIVLCLQDGGEEIIEGADLYVPRGAALYWMVRHYWHNPQDRPELTDGRALDRLREGRFELD